MDDDPLRINPPDGSLLPGGTPGPFDPSLAPLGWPGSLNGPQGPDSTDPFRFDRPPQNKPAPKQPPAKGAQVYSKAEGDAIGLLPIGTESDLNNPAPLMQRGCEAETVLLDLQEAGILTREFCKS